MKIKTTVVLDVPAFDQSLYEYVPQHSTDIVQASWMFAEWTTGSVKWSQASSTIGKQRKDSTVTNWIKPIESLPYITLPPIPADYVRLDKATLNPTTWLGQTDWLIATTKLAVLGWFLPTFGQLKDLDDSFAVIRPNRTSLSVVITGDDAQQTVNAVRAVEVIDWSTGYTTKWEGKND